MAPTRLLRQTLWLACLGVVSVPVIRGAPGGSKATPAPSLAKDIVHARAAWEADAGKVRELIGRLKESAGALTGLEDRISRQRGEIGDLEVRREAELEEKRRGQFCSGCGKTRTEILAQGDRFPHPGQHERPATPEELKAVEEKYAARLAPLRKQLQSMQEEQLQRQHMLNNAKHAFDVQIPLLHLNIRKEQDLRITAWGYEKDALERALTDLQDRVAAAKEAAGGKDADAARSHQTVLRNLHKQFVDTLRRAGREHAGAEHDADTFMRAAKNALAGLADLAAPLPKKFGLPGGWFMGQQITNTARPISIYLKPVEGFAEPVLEEAEAEAGAGASGTDGADAGKDDALPGGKSKQSMKDFMEGK